MMMTQDVYALLLDKRSDELSDKALKGLLSKSERAELRALSRHHDKTASVAQRIRVLSARMAQATPWKMLVLQFSKKYRANLAELESLVHYGHSKAVWDIAYLARKKASEKLSQAESFELESLVLYYDSPAVLRITQLKVRERFEHLNADESRELSHLHRNLYGRGDVSAEVLSVLWPGSERTLELKTG